MKWWIWLLIALGIFFLFVISHFVYIGGECNMGTPKKCDISCNINEDCHRSVGKCVNINEEYSRTLVTIWGERESNIYGMLAAGNCECIEQECTFVSV